MPAAGEKTKINLTNLPIYERIISVYEGNDLKVKGSDIYINGSSLDILSSLNNKELNSEKANLKLVAVVVWQVAKQRH